MAHHALELDLTVEKLAALGQLSLSQSRRTAFAILGEEISNNHVREVLRDMYAPVDEAPIETFKRIRMLDGGIRQ